MIELCQFYSVRMFDKGGFRALCGKGFKAGIKCHSERTARGCSGYISSKEDKVIGNGSNRQNR